MSVAVRDGSNPHYRLNCAVFPDDPVGTEYAGMWKEIDSSYACPSACNEINKVKIQKDTYAFCQECGISDFFALDPR